MMLPFLLMDILNDNTPLLIRLVNKQFEIIGKPDVLIQDIEEGVTYMEGNKKKSCRWWEYYFFETPEQEEEWKSFVFDNIYTKFDFDTEEKTKAAVDLLNMVYGMNVRLKKEGSLF